MNFSNSNCWNPSFLPYIVWCSVLWILTLIPDFFLTCFLFFCFLSLSCFFLWHFQLIIYRRYFKESNITLYFVKVALKIKLSLTLYKHVYTGDFQNKQGFVFYNLFFRVRAWIDLNSMTLQVLTRCDKIKYLGSFEYFMIILVLFSYNWLDTRNL